MDIVFGVENYSESEHLLLEDSDNLAIKDKIYLLTNIKFIILTFNNKNKNEIRDDGNENENQIMLNNENLDNDNLNNSDKEDGLLLADNKNNNTKDLFDISYEIYKEKWTKKKENIMIFKL